jgi:hypothetical protein
MMLRFDETRTAAEMIQWERQHMIVQSVANPVTSKLTSHLEKIFTA